MTTTPDSPLRPDPNLTRYVVGFAFCGDGVFLIRKARPAWQAGRLNGIGGHVEPGEAPAVAMEREFVEETGYHAAGWEEFCVIRGSRYVVHFYRTQLAELTLAGPRPHTTTDEEVVCLPWKNLFRQYHHIVPNLAWLVPMAANPTIYHATVVESS
jgi:8-oxo-dGTP diphosphatase